jgi:site-specific recombinase XerD
MDSPQKRGEPDGEAFLTHLAVNRRVAQSTPNQALGAIRFLFRHVVAKDWGSLDAVRTKRPKRLPTVLAKEEVRRLIAAMHSKEAHRLRQWRRSNLIVNPRSHAAESLIRVSDGI